MRNHTIHLTEKMYTLLDLLSNELGVSIETYINDVLTKTVKLEITSFLNEIGDDNNAQCDEFCAVKIADENWDSVWQRVVKKVTMNGILLGYSGPLHGAVSCGGNTEERVVRLKNGGRIEFSVNEDGIGSLTGYFNEPESVDVTISLEIENGGIPIIPIGRVGNNATSSLKLNADQEIPIWLMIGDLTPLELEKLVLIVSYTKK